MGTIVGDGIYDVPSLPLEGKVSPQVTDEVFEICLQSKVLIKSKVFSPQLKLWNVFDDFFMLAQKKQNAQTGHAV